MGEETRLLRDPATCPRRRERSKIVSGPGFAMVIPCSECGTIHRVDPWDVMDRVDLRNVPAIGASDAGQ